MANAKNGTIVYPTEILSSKGRHKKNLCFFLLSDPLTTKQKVFFCLVVRGFLPPPPLNGPTTKIFICVLIKQKNIFFNQRKKMDQVLGGGVTQTLVANFMCLP